MAAFVFKVVVTVIVALMMFVVFASAMTLVEKKDRNAMWMLIITYALCLAAIWI